MTFAVCSNKGTVLILHYTWIMWLSDWLVCTSGCTQCCASHWSVHGQRQERLTCIRGHYFTRHSQVWLHSSNRLSSELVCSQYL